MVFTHGLGSSPAIWVQPYNALLGEKWFRENYQAFGFYYWSSHLDGAKSEKIVPSGHSAQVTPEAIAEFKRILQLHLGR